MSQNVLSGEINVKVCAKVNLSLGINGTDNRGYHDLDMVLVSVEDIYDKVKVRFGEEISVTMDGNAQNDRNTAYKAALKIYQHYGVKMSVDIVKGIPFSAGLGGSSADAAAVLAAFAMKNGCDIAELTDIADSIGSDVAYMMRGGAAISRGQGSILDFYDMRELELIVMKAAGGSDTGKVFRAFDSAPEHSYIDNIALISAVNRGEEFSRFMNNDLFSAASLLNGEIGRIYRECKEVTPYTVMSGSGSSIVCVIRNEKERSQLINIASDTEYWRITKTCSTGIQAE